MGACGCRKRGATTANLSEEEALILPYEESLGFGKHTVMDLVRGLFEVTVNGEITEARFRSFLEKFAVERDGFRDPSKPLGRLFESFRESSGYLPARLGLLAALLGGGQDQPRGEAIFLCRDLDHNEFLSLAKVTELFTLLADIALFRLPTYAAECSMLDGEDESAQKLQEYVKTLAKSKQDAVAMLVSQLMEHKSNVTALKFSSAFTRFARWLRSASAMRAFARDPHQKLEAKDEDGSSKDVLVT